MLALSNGDISFDNKKKKRKVKKSNNVVNKSEVNKEERVKTQKAMSETKVRKVKKVKRKKEDDNPFKFDSDDISKGLKLMELSDDDLERGMEIITRTKKYMTREERKILIKLESMLDLVRGIKRLSAIEEDIEDLETDFFRSMDEEDKKNMMIKEILEVFPEKRRESVEKAMDMKKKIDLFAELFLPDEVGEGGFSLSSLVNINNLGSSNNLKLLGSLLRGSDYVSTKSKYEYVDDEDED
jgi:hypothetical protein